MSDLISREALLESLNPEYLDTRNLIEQGETHLDNLAEGYTEVHRLIKTAPTVDAVKVVRCGECKHYNKILNMPMCKRTFTNFPMNKDDFCSYGERKEGE